MNTKAASERYQRQVQDLSKQPGNAQCADCGGRYPRWASWNLGIFLCVNCAGVHRKMGTHISKVKSLTLDTWTREQVERMRDVGNVKNNVKFNPDERRNRPPANVEEGERNSELERFIFDKYRGRFMDNARPPPVPSKDAIRLSPVQTGSSGSGSGSGRATSPGVVRESPIAGGRIHSATAATSNVPASWSEAQRRAVSPAQPSPSSARKSPVPTQSSLGYGNGTAAKPSSLAPPIANVPPRSSSASLQQPSSGSATNGIVAANRTSSAFVQQQIQPGASSATSSIFDDLATLQHQQPSNFAAFGGGGNGIVPSLQLPTPPQSASQQMNPWAHLATQQQAVVSPMVMSHATSNVSPFFQASLHEQQQQQQQYSGPTSTGATNNFTSSPWSSQITVNGTAMGGFTPQMMGQQAFGGGGMQQQQQQVQSLFSGSPFYTAGATTNFASPQQQQQQQQQQSIPNTANPFGSFTSSMMPGQQQQQPNAGFYAANTTTMNNPFPYAQQQQQQHHHQQNMWG